jgi:tetratricopeptide (TPR) repeat protein
LQSFLGALVICEKEQEDDVASILALIYRGIGDCYFNKGDYIEALEYFAKCVRMMQRMDLCDDIEMSEPYYFIGLIYQNIEKYDESMKSHSRALLIKEKHHGEGSKECASSDFQIAKVLLATHKYEECIARFLNHLETYYGGSGDSEEIADIYHPLGLAQGKLLEYEESTNSLKKGTFCIIFMVLVLISIRSEVSHRI